MVKRSKIGSFTRAGVGELLSPIRGTKGDKGEVDGGWLMAEQFAEEAGIGGNAQNCAGRNGRGRRSLVFGKWNTGEFYSGLIKTVAVWQKRSALPHLTLSRWEREPQTSAVRASDMVGANPVARLDPRRQTILPLPAGEGRGEGATLHTHHSATVLLKPL